MRADLGEPPPDGWVHSNLGVWIESIEAGKSFRCDERPPRTDEVGVLKVSAVSWGNFQEHESKTCTTPSLVRDAYFVRTGDFLFSRANTIELVGACTIVAELHHPRLMLSDKTLRINFRNMNPKWCLWFLRSHIGRAEIQRLATGNQDSMRNIGQERIRSIGTPVAPSAEQDRVVRALESHLSRLDAAEAGLKRVQANLKRYRASVLKAAVEGRLVTTEAELAKKEGRTYEPASALLKRILIERRKRWEEAELAKFKQAGKSPKDDQWKAKYKEPAVPDTTGLPELSKGWCWGSLDALTLSLDQGWSPQCEKRSADDGEWAVMKTSAVYPLRFIGHQNKALPLAMNPRPALELQSRDLLVTRAGPRSRVGICCLVRQTREKTMLCDKVYRMRVSEPRVNAAFLELILNSPQVLGQIEAIKTGGNDSGLNLTQQRFLLLPIPVPPTEEQNRIAADVERINSVCDQIVKAQKAQEGRLSRLRQSILKWAFEGKLVDQDPNDEPASVHLDRIRAERDSAAENTKTPPPRARKKAS